MEVLVIIQARMGSKRLPGKIMRKIEGKSVLEHIITSLKFSTEMSKLIVATTSNSEDDVIEELAKKLNVLCFRGSRLDVLDRFYQCAKKYQGNLIVRITADCPLIEPTILDSAIKLCKNGEYDYCSNMIHQTYAMGYLVEVITFETLEKLHKNNLDPFNREHITPDIRMNPEKYKIIELLLPNNLDRHHWRLTLDYEEDFQLITKIFSHLYNPDSYIKYESVVQLLDNHPNLLEINKMYL
jgi:spore coat polysaccharide biosynthesis protein SpsF